MDLAWPLQASSTRLTTAAASDVDIRSRYASITDLASHTSRIDFRLSSHPCSFASSEESEPLNHEAQEFVAWDRESWEAEEVVSM